MSETSDRPLAIDLFCGLGGWTEGLLAEGYRVVGFDIERHHYGEAKYPAQLVIQDVLTLHGSQFKTAALIVASPPCQAYSYRAMPWKRAKALPPPDNSLFEACFRIQREASEAAGHHIPLVVENVRGAQKWVGTARGKFGSFYLWGDVPILLPLTMTMTRKTIGHLNKRDGHSHTRHLTNTAEWGQKNTGGSWFAVAHNKGSGHSQNGHTQAVRLIIEGRKQEGSGPIWFDTGIAKHGSKSSARKAASAHIAKIPFVLARHIARVYKPHEEIA